MKHLASAEARATRAREYYALVILGLVSLERGDHGQAAALGRQPRIAEGLCRSRLSANSWYIMGRAALSRGEHAKGRAMLEKSLDLYRECIDYEGATTGR